MLREGQLVASRYRIERRIAQGGMGAVFAAEHLATEERVALKVLFPHVLGSKSALESFQLEARVTARIDSEHIVRILDAGFDEGLGLPFLAMELLRGMTLRAFVRENGPLSPAEAVVVLRQVAKALDKAHGYVGRDGRPAPIVHRDLKPENLFVGAREGGVAFVKVLDFGLAKVLSESHHHSHEVKGTPLFMAREQFSHGPVTPQLDIWALGLIAFYAMAGRIYWLSAAQDIGGVGPLLNEILVLPLAPPSERALALGLTPAWPVGFDAWFLRCLEPDPQNRFASAGVAVEALAEIFASGAELDEAAIGAAASGLARRVAIGLESLPPAAPAAVEMALPPPSATRIVKTAELIAEAPPGAVTRPAARLLDSMTAPPSSLASGETLASAEGARASGASARARVLGAMVAIGGAVALAAGLAKRGATTGDVSVTSASALASRREPEVPSTKEPPPSPSAPATVASSNAAPAPAPAEARTGARPSAVRAPSPVRPPRAPGKSTKGAEAAKPQAGAVGGASPPAEAKPPPKPSPSEVLYNQP